MEIVATPENDDFRDGTDRDDTNATNRLSKAFFSANTIGLQPLYRLHNVAISLKLPFS